MKLITLISLLILAGCSSTPKTFETKAEQKEATKKEMAKTLDEAPKWFTKPPREADAMFEKAVSKSRDMQMAINKANMLARAQLALAVQGEINANMRVFVNEIGQTQDVLQDASLVTSQDALLTDLNGVEQEDIKLLLEGDRYVAYVLIKYPVGEMNKVMVDRIHQNNLLTSKLKGSKAFADLERKVEQEKLRQDKKLRLE
jgi:hypothetical protein